MSVQVFQPFEIFYDINGRPLDDGFIFIGQPNLDPVTNPISVFFDEALTIPAAQPIRTRNGFPANSGVQVQVFVAETTFSITIKNKNSTVIRSVAAVHSSSDLEGRLRDTVNPLNGTGISGYNSGLTDSIGVVLQSKLKAGYASLLEFGAVLDGVTDDSAALTKALTSGRPILHTFGNLAIKNVVVTQTCHLEVTSSASITLLSSLDMTAGLKLTGHNNTVVCHGRFNGNSVGRTLVETTGNNNTIFLYWTENVSSVVTSQSFVSGYVASGGNENKFYVDGTNYLNAGGQGSTPRLATLQGNADKCRGSVSGRNVNGGITTLVTTASIDFIEVHNATDNGIYNLGGSVEIGRLVYRGSEEAVVNKARLTIEEVFCTAANTVIGIEDAAYTNIGHVVVDNSSGNPNSPGAIAANRSGNTASGDVFIGRVSGRIRPQILFSFAFNGTVDSVSIANVDLDVEYDINVLLPANNFSAISIANEYHIRNWNIRVHDINDVWATTPRQFEFPLKLTPTRQCSVDYVDIYFIRQDGTIAADAVAGINIRNAAFTTVYVRGQIFQFNNGVIKNATFNGGLRDAVGAMPTAGTWRQGQFLYNQLPTEQGAVSSKYLINGFRCTVAGTPGTWLETRTLTGN